MNADTYVEPTPTNYVTLDLVHWHEQGSLRLSPKFQRRPVWKAAARSYLIDTILRGFPVPPLHIRLSENDSGGVLRDVIDGQQRLHALFDFYEGNLRLSRSLDAPWAGQTFAQLSEDLQSRLKLYKFHVFQYQGVDDATILQIFARINTYSVALNGQELRNGKWFGDFKQSAYSLALEYLTFWRDNRVFSEGAIARMQEAELVSELLVLQLDGIQDKKTSLNSFYAGLDSDWGDEPHTFKFRKEEKPDTWLSRRESEKRFRAVMDEIAEALGTVLAKSEFRRAPLFYSLYAVVYHRLYGIPRWDTATPRRPLTSSQRDSLRLAVGDLSDLLKESSEDDLRGWQRDFLVAAARQTDNVVPRATRLKTLWEQADLG